MCTERDTKRTAPGQNWWERIPGPVWELLKSWTISLHVLKLTQMPVILVIRLCRELFQVHDMLRLHSFPKLSSLLVHNAFLYRLSRADSIERRPPVLEYCNQISSRYKKGWQRNCLQASSFFCNKWMYKDSSFPYLQMLQKQKKSRSLQSISMRCKCSTEVGTAVINKKSTLWKFFRELCSTHYQQFTYFCSDHCW